MFFLWLLHIQLESNSSTFMYLANLWYTWVMNLHIVQGIKFCLLLHFLITVVDGTYPSIPQYKACYYLFDGSCFLAVSKLILDGSIA